MRKVALLLREKGISLPASLRDELSAAGIFPTDADPLPPPRPGPVGLIVSPPGSGERHGFVVPIRVRSDREWWVADTLPFTSGVLQDALGRLFDASGVALAQLRPYLFPHRVDDGLGERSAGKSMTVAGVLAVVAAAPGVRIAIFDRAAAVVQPAEHDSDGCGLVAVRDVDLKLRAFVREYERGTLLVRPTGCAASATFDGHFDEVWPVASWCDLARRLDSRGDLDPFHGALRLDRTLADRALARLRSLMDERHAYGEVRVILGGLARLRAAADLPRESAREFVRLAIDVERHQGFLDPGVRLALAEVKRVERAGVATTHDERARAAVGHAAALFDAHRFDEVEAALSPWADAADADPRQFTPLTRVMVWNTLGRARVITGGPGWAELFERSLWIQRRVAPAERHQTLCYLVHGRLRHGQLSEAARLLARNPPGRVPSEFSRWVLAFARADLARRRGEVWSDPALDLREPVAGRIGHPFGIYFQATARQPGRSDDDARARFETACEFFLREVGGDAPGNLLVFLAGATNLARAARLGDTGLWRASRDQVRKFTRSRHALGLARYHRDPLARLGPDPDQDQAEALLTRVPYF